MLKKTVKFAFMAAALILILGATVWAGGNKDVLSTREIVLGNWWSDWDADSYKPTNESQELMLDFRKRYMAENNFRMRERMVADWGIMLQTITTSIMAGRPSAQIYWVAPDWAMTLYRQKLLYPLSDSSSIDLKNSTPVAFSKTGFNQSVGEMFTFDGKQYAAAIAGIGHNNGMFYNKRHFAEIGLDPELPYDMQKAGTWTWDAYFDICKRLTRDIDNDGQIDIHAMSADHPIDLVDSFVYSNGAAYVSKNAAGNFVNTTSNPEFIEALQFIKRLHEEGVIKMRPEGATYSWYESAFYDGQISFLIGSNDMAGTFQEMTDDFGFVLPPKGPRAGNYRFASHSNVLVVPSSFKRDEVDFILAGANFWHAPVDEDWRTGQRRLYRDPRAVDETLTMIRDDRYAAFRTTMLIPGLETGEIAWDIWWMGDPAQYVESVSQNWNAKIETANRR